MCVGGGKLSASLPQADRQTGPTSHTALQLHHTTPTQQPPRGGRPPVPLSSRHYLAPSSPQLSVVCFSRLSLAVKPPYASSAASMCSKATQDFLVKLETAFEDSDENKDGFLRPFEMKIMMNKLGAKVDDKFIIVSSLTYGTQNLITLRLFLPLV